MNINTNYNHRVCEYPGITAAKSVKSLPNETEKIEKKPRTDTFERTNSQPQIDTSYTKYPKGSLEYAMAVYASAIQKPQQPTPDGVCIKKQDDYFKVEKSEESNHTHNDEAHSYNQSQAKESYKEDFGESDNGSETAEESEE